MFRLLESKKRARPKLTQALMNLACIVERTDESILPAVYFFIGRSLRATLPQLGVLTLCRAVVQALSSPVSGVLGDRHDRTHIVASGCVLWGLMTAAVGLSTNLHQAMFACALNGVGLALVIPSVQSVVADSCPPEKRGRAFGTMSLTSSLGALLGAFLATNAGSRTVYGLEGWRASFLAVAAVSLVTAALVLRWAVDPRRLLRIQTLPGDAALAEGGRGRGRRRRGRCGGGSRHAAGGGAAHTGREQPLGSQCRASQRPEEVGSWKG
ncbi:hypothetical protein QBZ16_000323 [Prototheca wickerhamii]|uniref:Major facilitator superfamily (MFS) profile domain-containing protein n=1 Tax=Prototheca wickerhamii TaxID=3111 RepID=A0AAD9IN06_PROWI|nr:hypothetical protein QBZ16_000323 [Prototheca wickerhamii]